jgi:hypothetical protein
MQVILVGVLANLELLDHFQFKMVNQIFMNALNNYIAHLFLAFP